MVDGDMFTYPYYWGGVCAIRILHPYFEYKSCPVVLYVQLQSVWWDITIFLIDSLAGTRRELATMVAIQLEISFFLLMPRSEIGIHSALDVTSVNVSSAKEAKLIKFPLASWFLLEQDLRSVGDEENNGVITIG